MIAPNVILIATKTTPIHNKGEKFKVIGSLLYDGYSGYSARISLSTTAGINYYGSSTVVQIQSLRTGKMESCLFGQNLFNGTDFKTYEPPTTEVEWLDRVQENFKE